MDLQSKAPRRRDVNFTTNERVLLAHLIRNNPIIENKATDGKTIIQKQAAWEAVTREFNRHDNVHTRETITLKRAWDNMKAKTRKSHATEQGSWSGGPPSQPVSSCDDASNDMDIPFIEIKNDYDSDRDIPNDSKGSGDDIFAAETEDVALEAAASGSPDGHTNTEQAANSRKSRKPSDYIRREAILRVKHMEFKKNMEAQILKTQLETEEAKKRIALLEEERSRILLEKAKVELKKLMQSME